MNEFMDFWKNYVNFSGRTTRRGYWMAVLFLFLSTIIIVDVVSPFGVASGIIPVAFITSNQVTGSYRVYSVLEVAWILAILVPSMAMSVRRLRDAGKEWTWIFVNSIPVVGNVLFAYMVSRPSFDEIVIPVVDLEKLLRSVPITRRNTPLLFAALSLLTGPVFAIYVVVFEAEPVDLELLLDALSMSGIFFAVSLVFLLVFIPMLMQTKSALKKADYMYSCITKLSLDQQREIESEVSKLDRTWRSKTYLTSKIVTPPKLGKHCLYGKVVSHKTFGMNQHVILPYQNIFEVIINGPEGGASKAIRNTKNVVSAVGSALSIAMSSSGIFTFIEKRPTILVIDDAGHTYQIDCEDAEGFLQEMTERSNVRFAFV